jgi:uncharacterized protein YkwD
MKKLFIILSILISSVVYGISPSDNVDVNNVDIEYIELLVLEKINDLRKEYGLNISIPSKVLKNKTRNHSSYMLTSGYFRHSHNRKGMTTECIVLNAISENDTYENISNRLFLSWKQSKGHKKSLLVDVEYAYVGISVSKTPTETGLYPLYGTYQSYYKD